jgi:NDP-sugar pyrophosphorylase family protein
MKQSLTTEIAHHLVTQVREAMAHSELALGVASVKSDCEKALALGGIPLRPLTPSEIERLEESGNSCSDWSRVRVADGFDGRRVRDCRFYGDIVLGRFTRTLPIAKNVKVPSGIERATLANCVIGNEVLVSDVKLLANCVVGEGAIILDCGTISCEGNTSFGNCQSIGVGLESGGRDVPIFAEMNIDVAAAIALQRQAKELLETFAEEVAQYAAGLQSNRTIIGKGAFIRGTPIILDSYIGPGARIEGATVLADSTLLGNADEPVVIAGGACVRSSLLQWGTRVTDHAVVDHALLLEHSHVDTHAKVSTSIVGPNTTVARGEVTSSLVGPFVSMHHQSLVIAALWPEGRGNISHGVMAGANHTSKAPDQEFRLGEGVFLGLGAKIRFPAHMSHAPYTLVAAGVMTLPQKILFPFSLINHPDARHPEIPPLYNEIKPAWVLTENLYALYRSESKFRSRNQARRTPFDFRVIRPETVELMREARRLLESVGRPKPIYTDRDIPGLGKNYLTDTARLAAIEGYQFSIRRYALMQLKEAAEAAVHSEKGRLDDRLLTDAAPGTEWDYARQLIASELGISNVEPGLRLLATITEQTAEMVERSKAKDDERGARIMDDYADVHPEAANDPIVRQTWEQTHRLQKEISDLLNFCGSGTESP